ncbi:hypothetical protein O6H91_18G084800 [Diphasiastrum complanatum]|uniref:Uncharacterized protein n=1 Tax=Diphasiastrum complanatum TaxID=34168 RepID=A0ACC2B3E7_DIPCM|nr:hypothetical protein O6H91_18G084800 [Diphasiastrum complanatum]
MCLKQNRDHDELLQHWLIHDKMLSLCLQKPAHPPSDRTMVIACIAEVAREIGPAITAYVESVMPVAIKDLSSTEATNRRNAAFCVGELCKNGGEKALQYPDQHVCDLFLSY